MIQLARKLNLTNYFALGFGTMIGAGWVVLMDDWLGRGGPVGACLGFLIGGVLLLPVGYVYGEWVRRLPDASGEAAYTAQVFPSIVSYLTGWLMLLAYLIVCPWEAVAIGKIAAYGFPSLNSIEFYRIAGEPVYLPRLLLGVALIAGFAVLNHRGIRGSAVFQTWATSSVLVVFGLMVLIGGSTGSIANLKPIFSHSPMISILLTLQIVPYFMTGFESVAKVAEEAQPGFAAKDFFKAITMALVVGMLFYALAIAAVALMAPWPSLTGKRFATVIALNEATGSAWLARIILAISLVALLQVYNGNFVASTRLLFAFGRRGTIPPAFSAVHTRYLTPTVAIAAASAATFMALLLGDAILVPVTEVGSMTCACGWFAACVSLFMVEKSLRVRAVSLLGAAIAGCLLLMKILPVVPGHFSPQEWIALGIWVTAGTVLHRWKGKSS